MSSFIMPKLEEAEARLDSLFAECGFASDHPAMQDWVSVKFALKSARQNTMESPGTDNQHTQPAICAWLKVNRLCTKWGHKSKTACSVCVNPRKQQAGA